MLVFYCFTVPLGDVIHVGGQSTISRLAGLVAGATGVVAAFVSGKVRRWDPVVTLMCTLALFAIFSYIWSIDTTLTGERLSTWAELIVLVWLVWELVRTRGQTEALLAALLLGSLITVVIVFYQYANGNTIFNDATRITAGEYDVNDLGLTLAVATGIAIFLGRHRPARWERVVSFLSVPILVVAVVLTASRGAAVALVAGILVAVFEPAPQRAKRVAWAAIMLVATVPIALALLPHNNVARLSTTISSVTSGNLNGRVVLWDAAITTIRAHSVIGIGSNAFPAASYRLVGEAFYAHNVFLEFWVELGILGLVLPIAIIARVWVLLRFLTVDRRRSWVVIYTVLFVGILVLNWEVRQMLWLLVILGGADSLAARHRTTNDQRQNGEVAR